MARYDRDKTGQPGGITHHPLEEEQDRQEQVPPRGKLKDGTTPPPQGWSTGGHRLSRQAKPEADPSVSDESFEGKGGKGGKTGGSRAGLLASRKTKKGSR